MCSHSRAYEYFAEIISSDQFVAKGCDDTDQAISGSCGGGPITLRTEIEVHHNGIFFFKTASKSPFGIGHWI
jgi:hypothetical protein